MSNIELRHYQKNQLDFIERKMKTGLGAAIKSPTGSGKSFVIMEYVKRLINEHEGENYTVVITTGFNNLVYQLEEDSKKFGLDTLIWVGQKHIISDKKLKEKLNTNKLSIKDHQAFTQDPKMQASDKERCIGMKCKYYEENGQICLYHQAKDKMNSLGPKVIITNHTSYLLGLEYGYMQPDLTIVDESHTFAMYYELYNTHTISPKEIEYIKSKLDTKDPTLMLFKNSIEKGLKISPQIYNLVKNKLYSSKEKYANTIIRKLNYFQELEPSIDKYIDIGPEVGMEVTKFWSKFDIDKSNIDYLLFSATQDAFTLNMFQIPRQNLYVEMDCNTIDYSESEFLVYTEDDYVQASMKFLDRMRSEGNTKGLMLSTTNKDVKNLKELEEYNGFKITTSRKEFDNVESNIVLAGSRMLFQGIDILDLDFVSLNKIPFPTYNEKFKAMANYLETIADMNPWTGFTIPKVENDITQSTGRLWRKPGDKGTIAIFDDRLTGKFSYLIKAIERERPGIKVEIVDQDIGET